MKKIPFLLALGFLAGCASHPAEPAVRAAQQNPTQKLLTLPPDQRAEYLKTHVNEFTRRPGAPASQ